MSRYFGFAAAFSRRKTVGGGRGGGEAAAPAPLFMPADHRSRWRMATLSTSPSAVMYVTRAVPP